VRDEECPHGLEADWCTLCKQVREGVLPAGVRRPPARRPTRPGPGNGRPPGRAGASRSPARADRSPADGLIRLRRVLFHAAPYGAWPSIAGHGLRTAAQLAEEAGRPPMVTLRDDPVDLDQPWPGLRLRDQRALARSRVEDRLDGLSLAEWVAVLNERVFLYAQQKDLGTLLARYQREGQDVLVFDTARLVAAGGPRVEVTTVALGAPLAEDRGPLSRGLFQPLASFGDSPGDIVEVTVVGGLEDVDGLVTRVVRYHPDRRTEVLVP